MAVFIVLMLLICIALPLGFAWRLWRLDEPTRLGWLLVLADTSVFVVLIMLLGRWDMAGLWSRYALAGLVVIAALVSLRRHVRRPWRAVDGPAFWRSQGPRLVSLALFSPVLAYVLTGVLGREEPRAFAFPLADGRFVVAQGGGVGLLNRHHSHRAQRQAIDITAVNAMGLRAAGLLPGDPVGYVIFGKSVTSPCDGTVTAARDGLPDLSPPATDRSHPAGNHVVLSCSGVQVELAHLRQGSVAVQAGERVRVGQRIGQVGNSGNSTEPHLHVHAVDSHTGAGLQMVFQGVVPVRNTVFRR